MNKNKIGTKIVWSIIVFIFVVSFSQFSLPAQTYAANNNGLNWDNPNKSGDNPYKLSTDTILNSQTMMQVVGCTGIVDKVTTYTTDFLKNQANKLIQKIWKQKGVDAAKTKSCDAVKAAITSALAGIPNVTYSTALVDKIDCKNIQFTKDGDATIAIEQGNAKEEAARKREECFNGLAYTLAKNQLTSMTRETVNWVNSGFNGNPMYVQNITSLTNSIEKGVLETGTERLMNGAFPYGRDFSRSVVRSYNTGGMKYGAENFLDSLASDLSAFVSEKNFYGIEDTRTELQKARDINNTFANDFSTGGWDGYLALTQKPQNNPLGFTMMASQYLANKIDQQATETKDELNRNNGILDQKKCVQWQLFDKNGKPLTENKQNLGALKNVGGNIVLSDTKSDSGHDVCWKFETVTPGSIIKDKLTTYVNSGERQLELADTINESLNNLFTTFIEKFRNEGLFGLSSEKYSYSDLNMGSGYGINSFDDTSLNGYSSGGYQNDSFDLTRDLGNTYNHNVTNSLGSWNAQTNNPELNINLGPYDEIAKGYYPPNYYYTVSVAGNTKLFNNGYNGWAKGDRAFWNGKEWQNWKLGQTSPIEKRGVIQTQKDYVVAAKEILKIIPNIMPKMGELDYCIPGPNPYFQNNSGDTAGAFQEYAGSLQSLYKDGSFFKRDTSTFSIAGKGTTAYDAYANNFDATSALWASIRQSTPWISLQELGHAGEIKKDRGEEKTQYHVDDLINTVNNDIKEFYKQYTEQVFDGVYGTMQLEFLEKENFSELKPNTKYLSMIGDGYSLTKDIVSYNNDVTTAIEDYKAAIILANSNAAKLTQINNEVSKIIQAAQSRRDANLLIQINKINASALQVCTDIYNDCMEGFASGRPHVGNLSDSEVCNLEAQPCKDNIQKNGGTLTVSEYKTKYAECLDEEDISYYNDSDIMNDNGGDEALRCHDNLDNDLDGLIDRLDPDCQGNSGSKITPPGGDYNGKCSSGTQTPSAEEEQTLNCFSRDTREECNSGPYYHLGKATQCIWTPTGNIETTVNGCFIKTGSGKDYLDGTANENCATRTESNCTADYYYDKAANKRYTCDFMAL